MSYYKYHNGKKYGPYENKPREHLFSVKDVARIAKHVADREGGNGVAVLAAVAGALGLGWVFCVAGRSIRSILSITSFFKEIGALFAVSQFVAVLIEILLKAKLVAPSVLKVLLAVCIAALYLIHSIAEVFKQLTGDIDALHDIAVIIDDICSNIQEQIGGAIDLTCDATGETCEDIKQTAKNYAWELKSEGEKAMDILDVERYPNWWEWF